MNLSPVRFGLTTRINSQQTGPSLTTNIALLTGKGTTGDTLNAVKDSKDPITVEIDIDENGKAVSTIQTTYTKQKSTVTLEDNTKAGEFWNTIVSQVQAMVPLLKSLEEVKTDMLAKASQGLKSLSKDLEEGNYQHLGTTKDEGFGGDYPPSSTATLTINGKEYSVHLKQSGDLLISNQADQSYVYFRPETSNGEIGIEVKQDTEDPGWHLSMEKDKGDSHYNLQFMVVGMQMALIKNVLIEKGLL